MNNPTVRFVVRMVIASLLAGLGATGAALSDGVVTAAEGVAIALAVVGALGVYAGVGYTTPVEPSVGK